MYIVACVNILVFVYVFIGMCFEDGVLCRIKINILFCSVKTMQKYLNIRFKSTPQALR